MFSYTQNNNESLNSLVWTFAPKHLHCEKKTVQSATFLVVCIFNEDFHSILQIMGIIGLKIGQNDKILVDTRDNERIKRSEQQASHEAKETRIAKRQEKTNQYECFEVAEGLLYGPCIAD